MFLFMSYDILLYRDAMPEWRLCINTVATLVHTYMNHTQLLRMCVNCLDILEPHPDSANGVTHCCQFSRLTPSY